MELIGSLAFFICLIFGGLAFIYLILGGSLYLHQRFLLKQKPLDEDEDLNLVLGGIVFLCLLFIAFVLYPY